MNKVSRGMESAKEKPAVTYLKFTVLPEVILQLVAAATLMMLAAVVVLMIKGAVNAVITRNLDFGLTLAAALNSLLIAAGAAVIALPLSVVSAIYINELARPRLAEALWIVIRGLSAIPSVVIGFIGILWLLHHSRLQELSSLTFFHVSLFLALMVYPSLTSLLVEQVRRIPTSLRAASYSLGASRWQTIAYAVYPAIKSCIAAAGFLGLGKAVGDTAVILLLWHAAAKVSPAAVHSSRLLTLPIAIVMEAKLDRQPLGIYAMAVLLMILSLLFSSMGRSLMRCPWRGQE